MAGQLLLHVVRAVIATVLVWAGTAKLRDSDSFEDSSRELLPDRLAGTTRLGARLLPVVEIATGVALLTPAADGALVAAAVLFGGFLAVLLRAWHLRLQATCACFGADKGEPVDVATVVRTGALTLMAAAGAAGALISVEPAGWLWDVEAGLFPTITIAALLLAAGAVAVAGLRLVTTIEAVIDSAQGPPTTGLTA